MSFYGVDKAEKQGSATLSHVPQLDATKPIEKQAAALSNVLDKVDDLTFKETTVRDVSDRGRQKVVDDLMRSLASGLKKLREQKRAEPASEDALATQEEVSKQLGVLRGIRSKAGNPVAAAEPLRRLSSLPIDGQILRKTKVALELNNDFWKRSKSPEVKQMVATLVRDWRAQFRKEEEGPSERTLRNSASDLEQASHALAPRTVQYSGLVNAIVRQLDQVPGLAASIMDGRERPLDWVSKVHKRVVAEKKNAGNNPSQIRNTRPAPPLQQQQQQPPEKRLRIEDGSVSSSPPAAPPKAKPPAAADNKPPAAVSSPTSGLPPVQQDAEDLDLDFGAGQPTSAPPAAAVTLPCEEEEHDPFGHGFDLDP